MPDPEINNNKFKLPLSDFTIQYKSREDIVSEYNNYLIENDMLMTNEELEEMYKDYFSPEEEGEEN